MDINTAAHRQIQRQETQQSNAQERPSAFTNIKAKNTSEDLLSLSLACANVSLRYFTLFYKVITHTLRVPLKNKGHSIPFILKVADVLALLIHPNHIVYLYSWRLMNLPPFCIFKYFEYKILMHLQFLRLLQPLF